MSQSVSYSTNPIISCYHQSIYSHITPSTSPQLHTSNLQLSQTTGVTIDHAILGECVADPGHVRDLREVLPPPHWQRAAVLRNGWIPAHVAEGVDTQMNSSKQI